MHAGGVRKVRGLLDRRRARRFTREVAGKEALEVGTRALADLLGVLLAELLLAFGVGAGVAAGLKGLFG